MDIELVSVKDWGMIKSTPFAIAGLCSAESEEQLYETCKAIKSLVDISLLRAGIWKPRTRPGSFEGVGEVGLQWFKQVKESLCMPITVEVASPTHVDLALKYDVDVLWIGARSTANPFTVQSIADSLKGVDIPVMVKNPINPDLGLWIGGIERLYHSGLDKIAAIHRGFSTFEKRRYRNSPMWQLAIGLKSALPCIPLICDPSHIVGSRDLISVVSQQAIDLNYDGLMIESHIDPDKALSDSAQQVTPSVLGKILDNIHIKRSHIDDALFNTALDDFRDKIDIIDRELLEGIASRMCIVEKIGEYKRVNDVTVFQSERWFEVSRTRCDWGSHLNIDVRFVKKFIELLHSESIRVQSDIVGSSI